MPVSRNPTTAVSLALPALLRAAGVQPPPPLLCCANRGALFNNNFTAAASSLCYEARKAIKLGGAPQSELRVVIGNYFVSGGGGGGGELTPGNVVSDQWSLEYNGATVQFTFAGSAAPYAMPDGLGELLSDAIYPWQFGLPVFPAGATAFLRCRKTVTAAAMKVPYHNFSLEVGEFTASSDGTSASQLLGTGAITTPSGGAGYVGALFGPLCIVGRAVGAPDIAVLLLGDSLADGSADINLGGMGMTSGATIGGGFMARALWNVNGRSVPFTKIAIGGTYLQSTIGSFSRRRLLMKYHTHAWTHIGTNDGAILTRTSAQVFNDTKVLVAAARGGDSNIRYVACDTVIVRCGTTDAGATVAGQTPATGFENGGAFRQPVNTLLADYVGKGQIDELIDYSPLIADPTQTDRWAAGLSGDGVHPKPATVASLVALGAGRVATWS